MGWRIDSVRSALQSRYPVLTKRAWRRGDQMRPSADRVPRPVFRSPDMRRFRRMAEARRNADITHRWAMKPDPGEWPAVTICTVTHESEGWLTRYLDAIAALDYPKDKLGLVVVDNGSEDGTVSGLRSWAANSGLADVDIVERRGNAGFGDSMTLAASRARTPYLLLLNPDAAIRPDALRIVVREALDDLDDVHAWEMRQLPYPHPKYYDPVTRETAWTSHAAVLLRREAFDLAEYGAPFFLYGEDVDFSYRLRGTGKRLRYVPKAAVDHDALGDTDAREGQRTRTLLANRVLRQQFGRPLDRLQGRLLSVWIALRSRDPAERQALAETNKALSALGRIPSIRRSGIAYPFWGPHFSRRRTGATVARRTLTDGPTVSIITRTHAGFPFLHHTLASVGNQTYPNIEHIVVQDGGDDAPHPLDGLDVPHGPIALKAEQPGRSAAGNAALAAATGEYVMFLDHDDFLFADHVEVLLGHVGDAPAAYGLAWEAVGRAVAGFVHAKQFSLPYADVGAFSRARLEAGNFLPIQSVLFRRDLFARFGGFDTSLDVHEDWDLWKRYAQAGDFVAVPAVTSVYFTPGSLLERIRRQGRFRRPKR